MPEGDYQGMIQTSLAYPGTSAINNAVGCGEEHDWTGIVPGTRLIAPNAIETEDLQALMNVGQS